MNRFLRVAYITCYLYTAAVIVLECFIGAKISILCLAALYIGSLLFMLAGIVPKLERYNVSLRILGIVTALCGAALLIREPVAAVIVYGVIAVLTFILALKLNYDTIHRDFATKFEFSVIVLALMIAALLMLNGGAAVFIDRDYMRRAIRDAVPCVIVTVAMGVMLLRGLRAATGIVDERQFNKRQLRDVLIFFGACIIFWAVDIPTLIGRGAAWLLSAVLTPVVEWIARLLSSFFELLVNPNPAPMGTSVPITPGPTYDIEMTMPPEGILEETPSQNANYHFEVFKYVTIILASIFVIIMIAVIISKLLKRGTRGRSLGYPNETREDIGDSPENAAEKPISRFNRDPRMRIRYIYQEFMRHLRSDGGRIERSDTCADIEVTANAALSSKKNEIAELSDTYRSARYDMERKPTQDDVARAKEAYAGIKNRR